MKLQDSTLFITGANRGLGLEFARHAPEIVVARAFEALEAGASEVAIDEWTQERGLSAEPGVYIDYAR